MSSAASSYVSYVDIVEGLLFLMAGEESSDSPPDYWSNLLEHGATGGEAASSKPPEPKAKSKPPTS
eukprot:1074347-Lingulodinium_polyedra.AAC.1